ncbi:MAG: hypothetical protein KDB03_08950 [Planctomycetales bacterium]|nr:hypothetical protein [Planctomycetales bacterium]
MIVHETLERDRPLTHGSLIFDDHNQIGMLVNPTAETISLEKIHALSPIEIRYVFITEFLSQQFLYYMCLVAQLSARLYVTNPYLATNALLAFKPGDTVEFGNVRVRVEQGCGLKLCIYDLSNRERKPWLEFACDTPSENFCHINR